MIKKNKKAISPLLSTIILIGLAIALGGVVINWGKAGYRVGAMESCEQTSLSLVSFGNEFQICNKNNNLYFTIENNGEVDLTGIKVSVLGDKDIFPTTLYSSLNVADIVKLNVKYGYIGMPKKVVFSPMFNYLGQDKICPKNGFHAENIREC